MLDIIIVNYNTRELTMDCIKSILGHTSVPFKLFVVDNGSTDGSVDMIATKFPEVTVIRNSVNEGYAKACNKGALAGDNHFIVFLNSDTKFIKSDWAQCMIRVFEEDPKVAVAAPKLINQDGLITGCGVVGTNANPNVRGWLEPDSPDKYNEKIECVSVCGACMMIKRENIKQLGLLDERYPFYFEETDYCYNARDKGFKVVYTPCTVVYHYHQGSSKNYSKLAQWAGIGKKIFDTKWAHMMNDERVYG
ncbi:glycosyltransferase family 2 protein [Aneurinibacillus sp. Ricciae_BoGa-3]|uniref:glycosyltransferase family 2 protein n=1 Tax=Aneurinibacillus sp. Ricciae_BoGa-3 TaxID=3022697 RepID=UPI002340BB70|nr:glycosyltransferase family 2 protein [Aneurinibacillus sp. Ricciae_BoGa-3]WCK56165.1 glycosyltransferase family 2 protein [Aneurinibacillus sp. Ricciae_BoGa-3]